MKHLLATLITLNTLCLFGQIPKDSFFILKGHITHNTGWIGMHRTTRTP